MTYTKEWYEEAARVENQHVRAVILKKDHLEHDRALEVANRAYEMAARALGEQHPAYAVALQNIGLYYSVIGNDTITAADYFERELDYKIKKATTLIEPLVVLFMGLIVGFVAVALVSAMYGIFRTVNLT